MHRSWFSCHPPRALSTEGFGCDKAKLAQVLSMHLLNTEDNDLIEVSSEWASSSGRRP